MTKRTELRAVTLTQFPVTDRVNRSDIQQHCTAFRLLRARYSTTHEHPTNCIRLMAVLFSHHIHRIISLPVLLSVSFYSTYVGTGPKIWTRHSFNKTEGGELKKGRRMSPAEFIEQYDEQKVEAVCAENIEHINSEVKPFLVRAKTTCTQH